MLTFLLIISSIPAPMARLLSDSSTDVSVMKVLFSTVELMKSDKFLETSPNEL